MLDSEIRKIQLIIILYRIPDYENLLEVYLVIIRRLLTLV